MIFKYFSRHIIFSRTFQESTLGSSTFQASANPVKRKDTESIKMAVTRVYGYNTKSKSTQMRESLSKPRGYKTLLMLNSTEHEISTAHKN